MSSPNARPSDVMDSNYWRPAEATAKLTTFGENFRLQRRGKIDAASFAQKVTEANANGWRKADRSLEYGELVDFSTLAIGSLVRFDREYLIGARHTSYRAQLL